MKYETVTLHYTLTTQTPGLLDKSKKSPYTYDLQVVNASVKEVFLALKENGFDHLRDEWFSHKNGVIKGGCALGQVALNLGVLPSWGDEGNNLVDDIINESLANPQTLDNPQALDTFDLNVKLEKYTLDVQLNRFKNISKKYYSSVGVGSAIVQWNDKIEFPNREYVLPTYADVVEMAYDVLKPYFRNHIRVIAYEYNSIKNA